MSNVKNLNWDSKFFGKKIGEISPDSGFQELGRIIDTASKNRFRCLYFKVPASRVDVVRFCEENKFLMTFSQITMSKQLNRLKNDFNSAQVSMRRDKCFMPAIKRIALAELTKWSRFYKDRSFGSESAKKLLRKWVSNYFEGKTNGRIFTYVENKKPVGFLLLKVKKPFANIDLIAVKKEERGRSIGQKLMNACFNWAQSNDITEIRVTTQAENAVAVRAYEKAGFKAKEVRNVYHKWL